MKSFSVLSFCALLLGAACAAPLARLEGLYNENIIPGHYIVMLATSNDNKGAQSIMSAHEIEEAHHSWLREEIGADQEKNFVKHKYHFDEMMGYSGKFDSKTLESIRKRSDVILVEADQKMSIFFKVRERTIREVSEREFFFDDPNSVDMRKHEELLFGDAKPDEPDTITQKLAPWGLSRISQLVYDDGARDYTYPKSAGSGVTAYVIDTGIRTTHVDFNGRAKWGATIPEDDTDEDCHGHGTHCAGVIGGETYGMAKKANLVAIKVLRSDGYGTNSDVIAGVNWVVKDHKSRGKGAKSVANMSLGGSRSTSLDTAVNSAVKSGIHFAVAAGNDSSDACRFSPSAAKLPITVAAMSQTNDMAYFSNFGPCVDIFAPGVDILSSWNKDDYSSELLSGTSMASPHVCGLLALYLSAFEKAPNIIKKMVISNAQKNLLQGVPGNTANILATSARLLH